MSPLRQATSSASDFFNAFSFIRKNGLRHYYIYPAILGILLFSAGSWVSIHYVNILRDYLVELLGIELNGVSKEASFWENAKRVGLLTSEFVVFVLLKIALFYLILKANKYVVLILLSPVMAFLSEKTEEIINGKTYPFSMAQFLYDIWRGVQIALRNMVLEIGITILLLLAGIFFPLIGPITAPILFVVGAYYYGFSTFDYICERRKMTMKESVRYVRSIKWGVTGNGALFSIFMMIPIVGTIIGPINATVAAVLTDSKLHKREFDL